MAGLSKTRRRTYRLGRRAEAADETRRRIVEATSSLHAERGITDTSMKEIAERAGVSVGTVYHHFPTYPDAIAACGAYNAERVPALTDALFEGAESRATTSADPAEYPVTFRRNSRSSSAEYAIRGASCFFVLVLASTGGPGQ